MKAFFAPFIICLLVTSIGCDGSKKGSDSAVKTIEDDSGILVTTNLIGELPIGDYEEMNKGALSILEYRQKEGNFKSYAAIEADRWYYIAKALGSDIQPTRDGSWIDFYPDLSYEYGDAKGTNGKGQYFYDINTGMVILVDNNKRVKPREYEAKIVGPEMVFVGQSTYTDNAFQCKLEMDYVDRDKKS